MIYRSASIGFPAAMTSKANGMVTLPVRFENKALGMSMQYGLGASLYSIREAFDTFRTESRLGDSELYQRIVFLNVDGTPIVDSRPDKGAAPDGTEPARWAPLKHHGNFSLRANRPIAIGRESVWAAR